MISKKSVRMMLGLAASILAIVIIIVSVDLREVWSYTRSVSLTTIFFLLALYLLSMGIRAWRWKMIIEQRQPVPFSTVFRGLVYGYMLNQLLPVKMGELARAEYLTRKEKNSRSFILGTIAVERVFDLLVIFLFLVASVIFSASLLNHVQSNWAPIAMFLILAILAVTAIYKLHWFKIPAKLLPEKPQAFINRVIDNLVDSFKVLRNPLVSLRIVIITLAVWLLTCASFYLICRDLGINIPAYAYLFIVSAGTFGMIIPSTSANVGVYHAVAMGAMMIFMVPREQALGFAVIAHAVDFIPNIVLGSVLSGLGSLEFLRGKDSHC